MKKIVFAIVFIIGAATTTFASDCGEFSEVEILKIKNQVVADVANDLEVSLAFVSEIEFSQDFSVTKGIRGNCEASSVNGTVFFKVGNGCEGSGVVSMETDAQKIKTVFRCR